jgi:hypothetical protein
MQKSTKQGGQVSVRTNSIRRGITHFLLVSTLYVGVQYAISLAYGSRQALPNQNAEVDGKDDNPFIVPSFGNGIATTQRKDEETGTTILQVGKTPEVVGSFRMPRNETLEMERDFLFGNGTVPIRKVFIRNYEPTPRTKFLLDYVVAGFAKCGTTALGEWLGNQHDIKSFPGEKYYMGTKTSRMIMELYDLRKISKVQPVKIGFRCPHYIQSGKGIQLLKEPFFSEAKIILSVRHPVEWFESYYNYRLEQQQPGLLKGTPNELIGNLECKGCNAMWILSTAKGVFHHYIARLKKTPLNTGREMGLLAPFGGIENWGKGAPNKVFFLEIAQLGDTNETRQSFFRKDMQEFLGLKRELTPMVHVRPGEKNKKPSNANFTRLDICKDEYLPVRSELMRISRNASIWFREYFLKSEDVFVSSREYLVELLDDWMADPCSKRIDKVS